MNDDLIWLDPDDDQPEGSTVEALRMEWTPPGLEREIRVMNMLDLSPRDDRIAKAACGLGAMEMTSTQGPLGLLGVWLFAGRQAGLSESYRQLEPMFTMRLLGAGDAAVTIGVRVNDDAATGDDGDPT